MIHLDKVNPNHALLASIILYPLFFRLTTPRNASASCFAKSREAISVAHSGLITLAVVLELCRQYDRWAPPGVQGGRTKESRPSYAELDIIKTQSSFGNAIVAYECGYLIQDFVVLILGARYPLGDARSRSIMAKNVNWRVLGWHHLGVASALGLFHLRALRGEEKGVLVVLMMFLMNISTPFGTLHWYLVNFHRSRRMAIWVTHLAYLAIYGLGRVYLIYWIVHVFGSWTGRSATSAFASLPMPCQLGTGAVTAANTLWLLTGICKFSRRYLMPK